ncbi:hypothetical protein Acr_11g0015960 [Actinidia rufa]|uniref:Retrotransposon gag domain-containing protein n=1 Tax=Actinidia rufa TaxID=165716 RepID=A0A7J0FF13_9ERIC|nr:hypothetical protein Acr_11g0015960 [Actinidia rufa]
MSGRRGRGRGRASEAQPDPFDGPQFMRDMAATMRTMARDAQREVQQRGAQFFRTNPTCFGGEPDSTAMEEWLEEMIKIFETLQIAKDDLRVSFATFQLIGAAHDWWKLTKNTFRAEGMQWEELISAEVLKAKRFERGLKPSIRFKLVSHKLHTYAEVVEKAMLVEEEMNDSWKIWEARSQNKVSSTQSSRKAMKREREAQSLETIQSQP